MPASGEAATQKLELKRQIFRRLGEQTGPNTILATNTSALPVAEFGKCAGCPERVIGLHFFNPVHRLDLVEVVRPRQAALPVVHRAVRFVQGIGKAPVVVGDAPGFVVNRVLLPYLAEAGHLFEEGVPAQAIDGAMVAFGMPMGPLRLIDEVGADTALHVAEYLAGQFGWPVPATLRQMVEAGRLGRKSEIGFYGYRQRKPRPIPSGKPRPPELTDLALQERLTLVMVNEAAQVVADGVALADDLDLAMVLGTGFAPYTGGPMQYGARLGWERAAGALGHLARSVDERFEPRPALRALAGGVVERAELRRAVGDE